MPPSRPLERRAPRRSCWLVTGFLLLVLLGIGALGLKRTARIETPRQKYVVVIDAGSTGTRLYAYTYDRRDPNLHLTWIPPEAAKEAVPYRPGIRAYNRVETLPGLQSLTKDAFKAHNSTDQLYERVNEAALGPLLNWARAVIPPEMRRLTSLRLLATAGVRGLGESHRLALLAVLEVILAESGFKYEKGGIDVMSGHQEGIYGWIALNHELGTFNASFSIPPTPGVGRLPRRGLPKGVEALEHEIAPQSVVSLSRLDESLEANPWTDVRIGALDLGGSSLEVTFPAAVHHQTAGLKISGSEYWLRSKTFDALGLNNAFQTSLWIEALKINQTSNNLTRVEYPCLFKGFSESMTLHPPEYLQIKRTEEPLNVTVRGSGSWPACKALVQEVVSTSVSCMRPSCLGVDAEMESLRFVGLNGFYVVWSFFQLSNNANLSQLELRGEQLCHQNWTSVQAEKRNIVQFEKFCFRSAFVSVLMQSVVDYEVGDSLTVAPDSISWPIGAAYLQIQPDWGKQPSFAAQSRFSFPHQAVTAFGVLGAVLLGYVCVRVVQRSATNSGSGGLDPNLDASLKAISHLHRVHEIKRRTFSYRKLHDLSL